MLRRWQQACEKAAENKYNSGGSHFFCQATPGAGKTIFAATLAKRLLDQNLVDLVLCFAPSRSVCEGIQHTFSLITRSDFSGGFGAIGGVYTYQTLSFKNDDFWQRFKRYRVFVVFDEIHHCAADEHGRSNIWGQQIVANIQKLATYTLALSGTPWRTDSVPIAMAQYTNSEGKLICDYQYSLKQAVDDSVCRRPRIVLADSDHLIVKEGSSQRSFSSIKSLLSDSTASYQSVIHSPRAIDYLLTESCKKLTEIRKSIPNAGGLVVAASVNHAKQIKKALADNHGQSVVIATYHHDKPLQTIEKFKSANTQWIVSVGMISEGTDIPRLQVCCHMSAVKTELYFRQVLGRILRVNGSANQEAWLYTFAEESLVSFAERIEQDIPETCINIRPPSTEGHKHETNFERENKSHQFSCGLAEELLSNSEWLPREKASNSYAGVESNDLAELKLGRFRQRVIEAFCY
ncbi:DEAD/DEAH box helicase [Photobacterium sp. DNB23_23_1]